MIVGVDMLMGSSFRILICLSTFACSEYSLNEKGDENTYPEDEIVAEDTAEEIVELPECPPMSFPSISINIDETI